MKKITLLLFTYFICISEGFACSCDTVSFARATEWADEIFFGRVIEIREVETYQHEDGIREIKIWGVLFEVEKKWKGSSKKYVEVFQSGNSCDFNFEFNGQSYLVYAMEDELSPWDSTQTFKGLTTWLCARNADYYTYNYYGEYGFDDRPRLDKKYPNLIEVSGYNIEWKWFGIVFVTFVIGLITGLKLKRNRSKVFS